MTSNSEDDHLRQIYNQTYKGLENKSWRDLEWCKMKQNDLQNSFLTHHAKLPEPEGVYYAKEYRTKEDTNVISYLIRSKDSHIVLLTVERLKPHGDQSGVRIRKEYQTPHTNWIKNKIVPDALKKELLDLWDYLDNQSK